MRTSKGSMLVQVNEQDGRKVRVRLDALSENVSTDAMLLTSAYGPRTPLAPTFPFQHLTTSPMSYAPVPYAGNQSQDTLHDSYNDPFHPAHYDNADEQQHPAYNPYDNTPHDSSYHVDDEHIPLKPQPSGEFVGGLYPPSRQVAFSCCLVRLTSR